MWNADGIAEDVVNGVSVVGRMEGEEKIEEGESVVVVKVGYLEQVSSDGALSGMYM